MKLITEVNVSNPVKTIITESANGEKQLFIEGIFIECDIVNKNGRLYPLEVMKPVVDKYIKEKVNTNRAWGELNHPDNLEINPDRISHRIVSLKQEGSNFIGRALISNTPCGRIVRALIEEGGVVAVSTRGGGDVTNRKGVDVVDPGFYLTTASDIVLDPSAPSAFVNGIMEGKEWILQEGSFKEISDHKKAIDQIIRENKYLKENRAIKFASLLEKHIKGLLKR